MKKLFSNKWTWVAIVAVIIIIVVIAKKKKAKTIASTNKKTVSGDSKFDKVLASLTDEEKAVWGKVDGYKWSDAEQKMMKDKGEAGVESILKDKVKLTDAEIDIFDNVVKKFAIAGLTK